MHEITFGDILKTTRLSKQNDIRRCKFAKKPKSACPVKKAQSSIFFQLVLPNLHSCLEPFNSTCSREAG